MSTSLNEDFLRLIENSPFSVRQIEDQTETIFSTVLGNSKTIVKPNFESVSSNDLSLLFQLYDQKFFGGLCRKSLGNSPLDFRVSSRMTRAGGKTSRTIYRDQPIVRFTKLPFPQLYYLTLSMMSNGRSSSQD